METSSEDIETENIIETNVVEDFDDDFDDDIDDEINNEVFSEIEIKKFEKIYNNEPIEESEISELETEKEKLNRKNEEAKQRCNSMGCRKHEGRNFHPFAGSNLHAAQRSLKR